jgi:DNA replication protein DnaC
MSIQQIAEMFRQLKLFGMARGLEDLHMNPAALSMSTEEQLVRLIELENHTRDDKRLKRLIRTANFKVEAAPEDIDFTESRGLDRQVVANLLSCEWIKRLQNTILTGLTGVGKTWLACSFGMQACRKLIPVRYFRLSRLLESIEIARGDGSLPKLRAQMSRTPLLILDDWGLTPLTAKGRHDLLELIDDRSGEGSVLITSQLPIDKWYDWINEPTIADAVLDRLVHSAHKIQVTGESMRKRHANAA